MLIFPRISRSPIPVSSPLRFTLPVLFLSTLFVSDDYPFFLHNSLSTTFGINCSPSISCHCTQLLSFHTLARSFALIKNSTLLFSSNFELFYKKHPGGVWGSKKRSQMEKREHGELPQLDRHANLHLQWSRKRTNCEHVGSSRMSQRGETVMRKVLFLLMLVPGVLAAHETQEPARPATGGVSGRWVVNTDFYGSTIYFGMELKQEGEKLSGNFDGDKLEGTLKGNTIYFLARDEQGGTDEGKATLQGGAITGTVVFTHTDDPTHPETHKFTAELVPPRRAGVAKRHEFVPTTFSRQFSALNKPVLTIIPGDSVHTTTVDAGGKDEKGVTRVLGGNMDFNEIVEDATVYLPVSVPGALLYVGDGHALQGDGELNGNALETSMDVEFTVDVIPGKRVPGPRVESATHLIAMGLAGSLDDAFRGATANMAQWLTEEYKLTPSEVAQVLGTSAEYKVSEVADRNAGIVLKINKERLKPLASAEK